MKRLLVCLALLMATVAARAGMVASLETESFVGSKKSWGIIRLGYLQIMPQRLKEIEGSQVGRFFPRADVSVLDHMHRGHFIKVICNAGTASAAECVDKRGVMEARVVTAVFLEAAPKTHKLDELVDPETWDLTPLGRRTIDKVQAKCPDFWERLRKMTEEVVGVAKD